MATTIFYILFALWIFTVEWRIGWLRNWIDARIDSARKKEEQQ